MGTEEPPLSHADSKMIQDLKQVDQLCGHISKLESELHSALLQIKYRDDALREIQRIATGSDEPRTVLHVVMAVRRMKSAPTAEQSRSLEVMAEALQLVLPVLRDPQRSDELGDMADHLEAVVKQALGEIALPDPPAHDTNAAVDAMTHKERVAEITRIEVALRENHGIQGGLAR